MAGSKVSQRHAKLLVDANNKVTIAWDLESQLRVSIAAAGAEVVTRTAGTARLQLLLDRRLEAVAKAATAAAVYRKWEYDAMKVALAEIDAAKAVPYPSELDFMRMCDLKAVELAQVEATGLSLRASMREVEHNMRMCYNKSEGIHMAGPYWNGELRKLAAAGFHGPDLSPEAEEAALKARQLAEQQEIAARIRAILGGITLMRLARETETTARCEKLSSAATWLEKMIAFAEAARVEAEMKITELNNSSPLLPQPDPL